MIPYAVDELILGSTDAVRVPVTGQALCAGFPSPADDFMEGALELPRWLVPNPPATFLMQIRGVSMRGAGIHDRDLACIDRSLRPEDGSVVVAVVDGQLSCKRYRVVGIGRASLAKLEAMGVDTVSDLADLDPRPVRKALTVVGERIIHELRGLSCLPLGALPAQRKGCAVTRSFSTRIEDRATLEQAVSAHATRLGEKLRREGLGTNHVSVFYHTSEHDRGALMRSVSTTVTLPEATNDTLALIKAARLGIAKTWREPGARPWRFSKAGVITTDLMSLDASPRALIGQLYRERSGPLIAAIDACNVRFGRGSVVPARAGLETKRMWSTKFEMRTPRYTTQVSELPIAVAG